MEIERKFLIKTMPELGGYPFRKIEQGYISVDPVIRIRRTDDRFTLTVKGKGLLAREELNLPMSAESYRALVTKVEGRFIKKTRYLIPDGEYTIELDVFDDGLVLAEVEFPTVDAAGAYSPPEWLGEDVTGRPEYSNSYMSRH